MLSSVVTGGILAGVISDVTGARAATCTFMLVAAAPMVTQCTSNNAYTVEEPVLFILDGFESTNILLEFLLNHWQGHTVFQFSMVVKALFYGNF